MKRFRQHTHVFSYSVQSFKHSVIFTQALSVTSAVLLAAVLVSAETVSYGPPSKTEGAPYAPSGWRPSGRQFLLPVRQNYEYYVPPAVYGAPTTTQQPTTTEQETTTTELPTTTEVRHYHSLSASPVFGDTRCADWHTDTNLRGTVHTKLASSSATLQKHHISHECHFAI
jgi:hypothetical protein